MRRVKRCGDLLCAVLLILCGSATAAEDLPQVKNLKITILSTMLADRGIGEWGFAALVEADGQRILFDTGRFEDTVGRNAEALGIELGDVEQVILSHNHGDHTGGLLYLREQLRGDHPAALSRTHVGQGLFLPRKRSDGWYDKADFRAAYQALGGEFVVHDQPHALAPGLWLTGPVPRVTDEQNYGAGGLIRVGDEQQADNIPEDLSLVINTAQGLVLLSGCGHAGIINTMHQAQAAVRQAPVVAAIGGFHLLTASPAALSWTAKQMSGFGVQQFVGAHCTGLHSAYSLRQALQLPHNKAVVGSVGTIFTLDEGISPGLLERNLPLGF